MHITCNRYCVFCIVTSCNIEIWNKNNIEKLFVISKLLLLLFNISSNLGAVGQHMAVNSKTMGLITVRGNDFILILVCNTTDTWSVTFLS